MSDTSEPRAGQAGEKPARVSGPRKAGRRRWPRRLLIGVAVVVLLIFLAPYLLSTGPGTGLILAIANPRLQGQVQVRDLSLSWLGGLEVKGLTVLDPDGREALRVEGVRTARGLWHAIWSWEDFERLEIDSPRAVLYVSRRDGRSQVSLAKAFSSAKPRAKPARPLPELTGQVSVASGAVRVVLDDGRTLELAGLTGRFDLATLDALAGEFAVELPGEGKLLGEFEVRGLVKAGQLRPAGAAGKLEVRTDGEVDLAPLAEFAGRKGVRGKLALKKVKAAFEPEALSGEFDVAARALAAPLAGAEVRPIDLGISGQAKLAGDELTGRMQLTGQAGRLDTDLAMTVPRQRLELEAGKILSAVLAGEPVELPRLEAKAAGQIDLAALGRAVPALLKLRPDVEVTAGTLLVEGVTVSGGSWPSAGGKLEVKGLTARRAGRAVAFEPITVDFDAGVEARQGLVLRRAVVRSEFARVDASGTGKSLKGRFDADLALLHRRLAEVFELGGLDLAGRVSGTADVAQPSAEKVDLTLHAEAAGLRHKSARGELKIEKAVLDQTGYVTLADGRPVRVTLTRVTLAADGALAAAGGGWFDLKQRSFQARAEVKRADLAYLAGVAGAMGPAGLERLGGAARLTVTAARSAADAPVAVEGQAAVAGLLVDGKPISQQEVTLNWSGAEVRPATRGFSVKQVRVRSDLAELTADGVTGGYARQPELKARVTVAADLARCASAAGTILKREDLPGLTGRLELAGDAGLQGGRLTFDGGGKVHETPAGAAETVHLDFTARTAYDTATGAFDADVAVARADLAYLAGPLRALGMDQLAGYGGVASLTAKLSRGAGAAVATGGAATVRKLTVDGKAVTEGDVTVRWSGAEVRPAERAFAAGSVDVDSGFAAVSARGLRVRLGDEVTAEGKVDVTADLAGCLAVARPFTTWKAPPDVAGRFSFAGAVGSAGANLTLAGSGGVDDLRVGAGDKAVREKRVDLHLAAEMDRRAETLSLKQVKVDSGLLAATASGTITRLRTERQLDLKGHYRASWERLSKVLHEFYPELAGKFELAGAVESDFTAVGPAHRPQVRPVFQGVRAGTQLGWRSGRAYGLELGRASLAPELADGKAVLPAAAIPASGGTLRVGGVVDFTSASRPTLRIDKLHMLEQVPVNVELGDVLLSRLNPVFHKANVARLSGKASLWLEGVELPLDKSIKTGGAGAGRLGLADLKLLPSGWLAELLRLGGVEAEKMQQVQVGELSFVIDSGRVRYDNFTLTFAGALDLRFSGSVYFDDRLEMVVSVPVRAELLRKLGVTGPVADYARHLEGARVGIPIGGTRQKPRLDLKAVDYQPLIRRAIQAYLAERAARILKPEPDQPRPQTQPAQPPDTQPATRPAKTPEEQIIESIFDLLRKKL